jgi:hypothetical protein
MPGLTLPSPESAPESWSPIERVGMACLRGCLAWMVRTTGRREFRGRSKVVIVPEVHLLTKTPDGASFLDYIARVGRALGASLVLDTQDPASILKLPGLVEQITTLFAFSLRSREQVDSLLELLGRPQTAPYQTLVRGINTAGNGRSIRHGHCIMRDRWDEVATVQIDIPSQRVAALLRTTPESEHANEPTQPVIPAYEPEDPFANDPEETLEPAATAQATTAQPPATQPPATQPPVPAPHHAARQPVAQQPVAQQLAVPTQNPTAGPPQPTAQPAAPAQPAPFGPERPYTSTAPTAGHATQPAPVSQQDGHPPTPNGQNPQAYQGNGQGHHAENGQNHQTAPQHQGQSNGQPNGEANGQHYAQSNGDADHQDYRHALHYESPIGPDEVYDQEADEAAYNEAMYPATGDTPETDPTHPTPGNKEHVA